MPRNNKQNAYLKKAINNIRRERENLQELRNTLVAELQATQIEELALLSIKRKLDEKAMLAKDKNKTLFPDVASSSDVSPEPENISDELLHLSVDKVGEDYDVFVEETDSTTGSLSEQETAACGTDSESTVPFGCDQDEEDDLMSEAANYQAGL